MATASMVSSTVTAPSPAVSCTSSCSNASAARVSSSASFAGTRLNTAAVPPSSRSSRSLVVRAEKKPNLWESITSAFGTSKKKATNAAAEVEKELDKAGKQARAKSEDLSGQAEKLKGETQARAEQAAEELKAGSEEVKAKVEESIEAAQKQ